MAWLRIDDGYDTNAKLLELTEAERWRWTRILIHCAKHRTEGRVSAAVIKEIGLGRALAKLTTIRLLDETDDPKKYVVHDWDQYNPKDPTKAERQARWRAKNASTDDGDVDGDVDSPTVHSRVGTRARPVPSPTPTHSEANSEPALPALELKALPQYEGHEFKLWKRLTVAAGVANKPDGIKKLENVVKAHGSTERELVMAIEAATGPGVKDQLAVALAELKKLGVERKQQKAVA